MYNKQIYDSWELHQDATQLEVNYKYFVKIIETLNVSSLLQYTSSGQEIKINDEIIIRQWQEKKLTELEKEFSEISQLDFPNNVWYNNRDIFMSSFFRAGFILNMIKVTNYKAQQSEVYYEPYLFRIASKNLSILNFEEWITSLTNTILIAEEVNNENVEINWEINTDNKVKNSFWFLENLCLSFDDIYKWYKEQEQKIEEDESITYQKDSLQNSLNHWIIFCLVDFYLKYVYDQNQQNKVSFQKVYDVVLGEINRMIKEMTFAITAFKSIAIFLNKLLKSYAIRENDKTIESFLHMVEITCSKKNQEKINELIFDNNSNMLLKEKTKNLLEENSELYLYKKIDKENRR